MYPNIYVLLKLRGLTQRDLGEGLHLCRNSIGNKLHGRTQWREHEMLDAQRILAPDMPLEDLFGQKYTLNLGGFDDD